MAESQLRLVAGLVESLLASSEPVKLFPGKWTSIRSKLSHLASSLGSSSAGDAPPSIGDSVLSNLLTSIASTVHDVLALARFCRGEEPFPGGKLLMRSELDVVVSKLDWHAEALDGIYASGILLPDSNAIVVSKPGVGCGREEIRFYLGDLLSRVRVCDFEMKARALDALVGVLGEDERYVRVLVSEVPEMIVVLVGLMECRDFLVKEKAAEAVSVLAGIDCCRSVLVLSGVVPVLVRVLESGNEAAARALKRLTENSDNAWAVSAHGGVTVLLRVCGDAGCNGCELVVVACGVLRNLIGVAEIRRFMVESGAVPVFMKMVRSKEEALQIQAMELLHSMAVGDEEVKRLVLRGGIESFLRILDPNSTSSSKTKDIALRAIEVYCFSSVGSISVLIESGFLERILFLFRNSGEIPLRETALGVVTRLCGLSEEARKAMGEMGFMPELVNMLEVGSIGVREMAAKSLSFILSVQKNQKRFIQDEQNVSRILQALNKVDEKPVTKKLLLSVIMSLTDTTSGRRKIVASGHLKNLEKLAETDAFDAKRIVKKLSGNRFRNILHAIWSS